MAARAPMSEPFAERVEAALRSGGLAAGIELCERAAAAEPQGGDAYRHLGVLHATAGARGAAIAAAKRACELAPDEPRAWSDFGRTLALLGDLADAARCFQEAVTIDARFADGWHNLGTALRKLGRADEAFAALKNALLLDPARADTYLNLGNLLIDSGQLEDALECFERAAKHDPTLARARSRLADQLAGRGKLDRAETLFRQSLALDPEHLQGWLGLGRALEDLGDADGALGCYRNALARRPSYAPALGHYLALLREEATPQLIDAAHAAMASAETNDEARSLIAYGLAKYHDRHKDYARAAAAGAAANAARRRTAGPLDRSSLAARVDGLIETFDAEFFEERRELGMGTDQPVFIVGLPRSGTTLTEQIIAAHPLLHGAGELPDLARLAARAAQGEGERESDGDGEGDRRPPWRAAAAVGTMQSRALAQRYLRALREGAPQRRVRISDKSPLNFFHLAFAAVLFPNARVIHCKRDARDNALSIWMENFNPDQRYATDFDDLAFFTFQYERLMAHWRSVLPLPIFEVRYEDTVADVENQARRIVAFLGVPWDARCLDFHGSGRAVQTPSRWQVRQPIYNRSVERWRRYAPCLPALERAFADGGARSG
jgi:tetratricopeptide (TPR) repeat protein